MNVFSAFLKVIQLKMNIPFFETLNKSKHYYNGKRQSFY